MRKLLLFLSSTFIILNSTFSQAPLVKQWDYRFGGSGRDWVFSFQQTTDDGFILGGDSNSGISGDKTQNVIGGTDFWIIKLDAIGNKQWDKDFGGIDGENIFSLRQTTDGGYILGGPSTSGISGDKTQANWDTSGNTEDYWIVKTDSLGNKQWDKDFGGTGYDHLYFLQQTSDRGYILGGSSTSGISGDKTQACWGFYDYWVVKTDSLGTKQWDRDFGGDLNDNLFCLQETSDRGYILGGISYSGISGDKTQASLGISDYWIVKIDSLGNKQWDKDFGGTGDDILTSLHQTSDHGYILGGSSNSGIGGDKTQPTWNNSDDYWIIKLDSSGNKQWDKDYGGTNHEDWIGNLLLTSDEGFLFTGMSYSQLGGDKTENNLGPEQSWIIKTDSLGNKEWDKTIFTNGHDELCFAVQTKDGCYAFASYTNGGIGGYKTQDNRDTSNSTEDCWIIKFCDTTNCNATVPEMTQTSDTLSVPQTYTTYQWYHDSLPISGATNYFYVAPASGNYNIIVTDSNGCSVGAGIINVVAGVADGSGSSSVQVYPNPNDGSFEIKYYSEKNSIVTIEIINTLGEIIYKQEHQVKQGPNSLSFGESLSRQSGSWGEAVGKPGVYFLSVQSGNKFYREKIILSH